MNKKQRGFLFILTFSIIAVLFIAYISTPKTKTTNSQFKATVLEVVENNVLVEPFPDTKESNISKEISIPIKNPNQLKFLPDLRLGDIVDIEYSGEIQKKKPENIEVINFKVIGFQKCGEWDRCPNPK